MIKPRTKPTIEETIFVILQHNDLTQLQMVICTGINYTSLGPTIARLVRNGKIEYYETGKLNTAGGPERKYCKAKKEGSQEHVDFICRGAEALNQKTVTEWKNEAIPFDSFIWALFDKTRLVKNHQIEVSL